MMFRKIRNRVFNLYFRLISSIAFLPSIISAGFFILALLSLYFFDEQANKHLHDQYPGLIINNADTARAVLSAFIGGIISLTSFSFSMVMLLLSQASSNFSPRLLPDLISDTRNQVVLGVFLGTIFFMVIVLISIIPSGGDEPTTTSGFSVLIAIIFGLICLGLFVYFIHIMSTAIQIDNILRGVYHEARDRIQDLLDSDLQTGTIELKDGKKWEGMSRDEAGYFQGINVQGVLKKAEEEEVNLKLVPFQGKYIFPNEEIIMFDKELEEETKEEIFSYIVFSNNHQAADNYVLGIKQITEVGVKAMSPGINDPGTAIVSIDYLTHILALRLRKGDTEIRRTENESYAIEMNVLDLETILYETLSEYRIYCKHDYTVVRKLIEMLVHLLSCERKEEKYKDVIMNQLRLLKTDFKEGIKNEEDVKRLLSYLPEEIQDEN